MQVFHKCSAFFYLYKQAKTTSGANRTVMERVIRYILWRYCH
jgi:hypothetical protein